MMSILRGQSTKAYMPQKCFAEVVQFGDLARDEASMHSIRLVA